MLYQVLTRENQQTAWEPFHAMTRDPLYAMALVRKAGQVFAEVSVIQAATALLLREQVRQIRAGQPTCGDVSATPSLTATPRLSLAPSGIEDQRWAMERGPGGDHDVPYRFEGQIAGDTLRRWVSLIAAAHGDRISMPISELTDQSRETADDEAGELLSDVEPVVARTERAS
ncbi:MAG TPA: hypothetical protein VF792_00550 [Ktedonobacterales bacterium]